MCGRFTHEMTWAEIHALYSIHNPPSTNMQPRYNISPTQDVDFVHLDKAGDTIWIGGMGQSLRLRSFDTPEPTTNICGGAAEVELAHRASARLLQLLNENEWTVEIFDTDRTGRRLEATIRIDGVDVGDILIAEGLARRWPDGDEWWCRLAG